MSARERISKILMTSVIRRKKIQRRHAERWERRKWDILRGDKVQVISSDHPERGKQGVVLEVLRKEDRVLVKGVNMYTKKIEADEQRGIPERQVETEGKLPYSAVNLVDPVTNKPTRIFRKVLDDGTKVRVSKKSGAVIPRPEVLTFRRQPLSYIVTESCTGEADAWEVTYPPLLEQQK
jgi:large subunit ribosomal protein L24